MFFEFFMPLKKIKIGISSCLLGNNVRYDGGNKLDPYLRDELGQIIEWVPLCPEADSGLPVPREAMQLVAGPEGVRLVTIETGIDHTGRLADWAQKKVEELEEQDLRGFVFKARSPSCGLSDAPVVGPSGPVAGRGPGLFAAAFMQRLPFLPVEDEGRLRDPVLREIFVGRIFARHGH